MSHLPPSPETSAPISERVLTCRFIVAALAFAAAYYGPLVYDNRLPGNTDTWLAFDLAHYYLGRLAGLFGFEFWKPLAPDPGFAFYGEPYPAVIIPLLLSGGTLDIAVFAAVQAVLITAINATGTFVLARALGLRALTSSFAGLAFACSTILLDNVDSGLIDCYGVLGLCLALTLRNLETGRPVWTPTMCFLLWLQAHMSIYVFLFLVLILALVLATDIRRIRRPDQNSLVLVAVFILGLVPLGYGLQDARRRLETGQLINVYRSGNLLVEQQQGPPPVAPLTWKHFKSRIDTPDHRAEGLLQHAPSAAWPGLVLTTLALFCWIVLRKQVRLLVCALAFAMIAVGPTVSVAGARFDNPIWLAAEWTGFASFLRVAIRAWSVTQLCLALAAATTLNHLLARRRPGVALAIAAGLFAGHAAEHIPLPPPSYRVPDCSVPPELVEWSTAELDNNTPVLFLPSKLGVLATHGDPAFFEYNREFLYMSWLPSLQRSIFNGAHGYIPRTRVELQLAIDALPKSNALTALRELGVSWIALPKCAILPGERRWAASVAAALTPYLAWETPNVRMYHLSDTEPRDMQ